VIGERAIAVRTTGLVHRFGAITAVDGVDLEVAENQLYGIVGPDGAGKTTLLRMLVGVLGPHEGTITLQGLDLFKERAKTRPLLGYMSQAFSLYEDLTVSENIAFFAAIRGVSRKDRDARANRVLEATGLAPFTKRYAGQLSGGMKQKLGLVCTLVHEPKVLFLDEPTNGVDPVSRREFWEILGDLRQRITIVVSTPSLDEAERCDTVALMAGGKLLRVDSPAGLRAAVSVPVWEVEVEEPFHAAAILAKTMPKQAVQLFGDRVHVCHQTTPDAIRAALSAEGHTSRVNRIEPSLEDAYVRLVTGGVA